MGKITKTMQPKHKETLSPWLKEYIDTTSNLPLPLIRQKLDSFPQRWASPRGDLYHWIPLLNRFDNIMESIIATYDLHKGMQTRDFGCDLLLGKGAAVDYHGDPQQWDQSRLAGLGFDKDGDKQLLIAVLKFSQMLLAACGNRSIYMSSAHLNDLLNSTYYDVVIASLEVGQELAQRYQASVKRMGPTPARQMSQALLANHYNIDLDKVQVLAQPFVKTPLVKFSDPAPATPASANKGKEKAHFGGPKNVSPMYANDLKAIVAPNQDTAQRSWDGWGDIKIVYYPKSLPRTDAPENNDSTPDRTGPSSTPATPTPLRRSTTMPGIQTPRAGRQNGGDDSSPAQPRTPATAGHEETASVSHKVLEVPQSVVATTSIYELLARCPPDMPLKSRYEYLNRLRVAKALLGTPEDRQKVLSIRLLAINNLAYIHPEKEFLEKVLKHDDDEPRRTQLVYQLADLIHPAGEGEREVPLSLQSIAFNLLEMISHFNAKHNDVLSALNANVNHGVLLYVVRKAVERMSKDEVEQDKEKEMDMDEWITSLLALAFYLALSSRLGPEIVAAGLMDSLIEIIKLRTATALRYHSTVFSFLDNLVAGLQGGFQSFNSPGGLEAVADLLVYTVSKSQEMVAAGQGNPPEVHTSVVDYDVPFYQQQTLKWGLKFIHRIMAHFSFGANTDRVLRNMVDNSALLRALRSIIENKQVFGTVVWTGAVTLLSDFLNNDPTSFAAIQESGMIKGFLEALTGRQVTVDVPAVRPPPQREEGDGDGDGDEDAGEASSPESQFGSPDLENDERPHPPTQAILEAPREVPIARGILPSAEAICIVPTILNSICLNNAGMKMVVQSRALDTLMEIFESPEHVRLIDSTDGDCFHTLGTSIDELARHHPALRKNIGDAIVDMMARVVHLAYRKAETDGWGAKLLVKDTQGNVVTADQRLLSLSEAPSRKGKEKAVSDDSDVEMVDASEDTADSGTSSTSSSATSEGAILPHISALYIFFEAIQPNANLKAHVIKAGGIELLLKLMEAPSLPSSCVDSRAMRGLSQTAAQFIDAEPIIGVPSLLRRLQKVLDTLEPLAKDDAHRPFFAWFLLPDELFDEAREHFPDFDKKLADGTRLVKALVHAQVYMRTLHGCFPYHRGATYTFPNVNVYDYYTRYIKTLGPLLHSILKEEITLSNKVPSHWAKGKTLGPFRALGQMPDILPDTRPESTLTPEASATDLAAAVAGVAVPSASVAHGTGTDTPKADEAAKPQPKSKEKPTAEEQTSPQFLNYKALTTLLNSFTSSSYPVLQVIGKALFSRKDRDAYVRYRHTQIAESLADTIVLSGIDKEAPDSHFHYWLVVLHAIEEILIDQNRHSERQSGQLVHIVLPVLIAFKDKGGLEMLNTMLQRFADVMLEDQAKDDDGSKAKLAAMGMKKILDIYAMLVHGRNITELNSLLNAVPPRPGSSSSDRRPELGQIGSQIVVELRMSILPVVRKLWDSKIVEKCSTPVLSKIIDILKTICAAEQEGSAYRRSDTSTRASIFKQEPVRFNWSQPALDLARAGADDDDDLVKEAVYRTYGKTDDAMSYCEYHKKGLAGERNPIPPEDAYQSPVPGLSRASGAPSPPATLADAMNLDPALGIERLIGDVIGGVLGGAGAGTAADDDSSEGSDTSSSPRQVQFNDPHPAPDPSVPTSAGTSQQASAGSSSAPVQTSNGRPRVVTEDLDEARSALRNDLIDRCLDVLQVHPDSVFEVSELIQAAILRSETEEKRREVGEVLANALMSFASEDDKAAVGQSIAAYAHLLSLLLQDKLFYKATLPALKENISAYLGFLVPSMPSSTGNDGDKTVSVPWMPYILLIFEIMLAEDEVPVEVRWKAPTKEDESIEEPVLVEREPNLQAEERTELVQNVLALLPHIGKDEALATSALRILAIVTRQREIAKEVGSRKQLQRLFVMAKQLCGAESGRLRESRVTKSLLIILRHVIEDEDTIRQIMRTEIKTFMDNAARNPRTPDLGSYLRHLAHVALRNPQIFIEVTADMVKFSRWTPTSSEVSSRQQPSPLLVLKESAQPRPTVASNDVSVEPAVQGTEDLTINDVKPSTEAGDKEMADVSKTPAVEMKPPVLENPDGVVHFILCELLNYREVEDKEVASPPTIAKDKDSKHEGETTATATPAAEGASSSSEPSAEKDKKTSTPKFRAEEHPIYVYRCFLLHCLTELLQSYSRAKVEFINFKRSAPIQAATPVKPRSSVLNYLLHDLLCQNNLTMTPDTIALKKKAATSAAAQQVLVALMAKTGEKPVDRRANLYEYDDEADLLFVRRFVLDTILKAYKGTTASAEPFDIRYAKMLSLADLMTQMIGGGDKDLSNPRGTDPSAAQSQAQIKRLMFEKGYLPALTASIAEIDLTFPDVKRTIKYILRVLKSLTKTAISLSHANLITDHQAETVEDEIASASSLSDMDDDREETPDLYRNSTLGMLEPGGGEDDYSEDEEDEDEEMYDDEYGDEMDYGEEISEDNEEDVSDEDDEEIGGMGPIEGLSGDLLPDFDFDEHMQEMMQDEDMDEDDEDMDEDDDEDEEEEDDDDEVGSEDIEELEDRVEIIDEEGNPVDDDGQSGWEDDTDDDDEGDEDEEEIDYDAEVDDFAEPGNENSLRRFGHIMRAMGGGDPDHNPEDIVYDPYLDDGEDDEDDPDDDMDDDLYYGQELGMGHEPVLNMPAGLGWDTLVLDNGGHHRHRHGGRRLPTSRSLRRSMASVFPGARQDGTRSMPFLRTEGGVDNIPDNLLDAIGAYLQAHYGDGAANTLLDIRGARPSRPLGPQAANPDDGLNPLLRRDPTAAHARGWSPRPVSHGNHHNPMRLGFSGLLGAGMHEHPLAVINEIVASMPNFPSRPYHALHFQITRQGADGEIREVTLPMDYLMNPPHQHSHSRSDTRRDTAMEPHQAVAFTPVITVERWQEEARMVFGHSYQERAPSRLSNAILFKLVPPAIEHEKEIKAREAEEKRKRDEERKKREEEERKVQETKEAEEKAAREKKEAEERERAEREAAAAAAAQAELDAEAQSKEPEEEPEAMEGVETTSGGDNGAGGEGASSSAPRVTTTIRGEIIDVTELGIDPDYLAALPEEYREEVIAHTVSSRRLEAREAEREAAGENTEVYQEFLDALPDDLRAEIVQQERHERRRRDREEQRRQANAGGQDVAAQEMDPASILLTFPPELREQVFSEMEQGDELMDQLPPGLAAEARAIAQRHGAIPQRQGLRPSGFDGARPPRQPPAGGAAAAETKPQRRTVVQMLDKQGIATLLRLIFVHQPEPLRKYLQDIFVSVCENRLNRLEVISTLLLILQDGSTDVEAVERSFGQLSLKAKPPKEKDASTKTPGSIKRSLTNPGINPLVQSNAEVSPLLVVQQCLDLLTVLSFNPHVPSLFLTEHDIFASQLKRGLSRKGKGKEVANTKAQKYAINYLLGLLDRDLVMESSNVMQTLADLLNKVTYPLQAFERKRREEEEAKKKKEKAEKEKAEKMDVEADGAPASAEQVSTEPKTEQPAAVPEEAPTESNAEGSTDKATKPAEEKKVRQLTPPTIPEANLKLVTNIFVARECSSKTFQNTISTIKNLSYIPGAKRVFGEELVRQARVLSENIVADLDDLLPHILKAESGTQIQGIALAKFSPGASEQNKLLRVLTALDHLFDKKGKKSDSSTSEEDTEKGDLLGSLYWNPTFGTMWDKLSACLAAIRERENMLNVATILLPLIESLMVVCKNTTINDAPLSSSLTGKDMLLSSPPPENRIAGLFFTFTEDHRRILNELVRNNPKLMSGTFSLLVKNPKVLEFDNKRNYFTRSVHHKTANQAQRPSYPALQLSVRRDHVFHDSFKSLYFKTGDEMKFGKLNIRFHGEEGVDAGGVTREWFQSLSRQMFDANYALFVPVSSDRTTFHPNKLSGINEEHLHFFKFIGRVIGKALYEGRVLDCYFSRAVYKRILGKAVSVKDMESFDPDYYKSLTWMLENDITDIITETFSVEEDAFGVVTVKDLMPNGRNIPVTEDNKQDYVRLVVEHKLLSSVSEQMEHFLKGFHEIIPPELIAIFNEQELELLISGLPDIDVDDWKAHTEYHNYNAASPQIQWFWRAVRSFDKEERAKLLQFVTGTSKVPLNGFKELEGMNGVSRFNIHRDYGNKDRLPSSHTCFNQLDLPEYESYDILRSQILKAITAGSDYFGFA